MKPFLQKEKIWYKCLVGGASKWKHGMTLLKAAGDIILYASIVERLQEAFVIELSWNKPELSFAEVLHAAGVIPLPPYLHRDAVAKDKETYQTIYAAHEGSVAAPTAGLHFTKRLFKQLKQKNIEHDFITLHVGAGTFKPVKATAMKDHEMHAEFIDVDMAFLEKLMLHIDNVVAVGTTSLRTIESLYWMGAKLESGEKRQEEEGGRKQKVENVPDELMIHQWDAYELKTDLSAKDALQLLINYMKVAGIKRLITKTQIIIAPGYEFKVAKGLITNFHQPQSTLLLLVAAMIGDDWKKVYDHALTHDFRFLSYGDGSLLWKRNC